MLNSNSLLSSTISLKTLVVIVLPLVVGAVMSYAGSRNDIQNLKDKMDSEVQIRVSQHKDAAKSRDDFQNSLNRVDRNIIRIATRLEIKDIEDPAREGSE